MKNEQIALDSKDLLVVMEMAYAKHEGAWTYDALARQLGLSASQVHGSVARLMASGLLTAKGLKGEVNRRGLADFIIHGARYVFPAVFGKISRGIKTGVSSEHFGESMLIKDGEAWVWPSSNGNARGMALAPIHPSALKAIQHDPELHKALVHFDALRAGSARERKVAEGFFQSSLAWRS